jgi:biotin transport system substrate-specific component
MIFESRMQLHPVASMSRPLIWMRNIGIIILGSLVVALCAHVALPLTLTPVPLTLQPFAVLLIGLLLPPGVAFSTMLAYLIEGALGLPVFTPGSMADNGVAHLMGPTAGYLLAYPFAVAWASQLWRSHKRSFVWGLISATAGDLLILVVGALWLNYVTHSSFEAILDQAVIPFLPGEALKIIIAAGIAAEWQRLRRPPRQLESTY